MTAEFFDETVLGLKRRVPFHPFTVALINGDRFEVDFPDALMARDGQAVYFGPNKVLHIFDHQGVAQFIGDLMNSPDAAS